MDEPRPSRAQKLFDKASHPKGKAALSDRLSWLESALDIHPEDPEVLMASAELTFKATSLDPDMWGVLIERLNALDELCPSGMPEALYLRGAMAYMNDRYDDALTLFQAYLALPENLTRKRRRTRFRITALPIFLVAVRP